MPGTVREGGPRLPGSCRGASLRKWRLHRISNSGGDFIGDGEGWQTRQQAPRERLWAGNRSVFGEHRG